MAKKRQKQTRQVGEREKGRTASRNATATSLLLGIEAGLRQGFPPAGRNARSWRQALLLHSQQQVGNRATGRFVQRQTEEEEGPMDAGQLGVIEQELEGHPQRPLVQRANGGTPAPTPSPVANITLNVNPPAIVRLPAATIATNHGTPGVAGWTTPQFTLNPTNITSTQIDITVTLDFRMELATEYTGPTLDVLRDHEQGHVLIGRQAAQTHFVEWMGQRLETLPRFSVTPPIRGQIQGIFRTASQGFRAEEVAEAQGYDSVDYPRMREAYLGARTPLADLEAGSPAIGDLVQAIADFRQQVLTASESADEAAIGSAADQVMLARMMLSEVDMTRLQYNPEFKALISDLWRVLDQAADLISVDGPAWNSVSDLRTELPGFEWAPPV